MDAYQEQYRSKFRFWTEPLLLVCRIILFAIYGGNPLQRSSNQPLSHNNYICNSTGVWVNAAGKDETTWILKLQHSDRWDSLLEIMRTAFSCSKASCFDLHHGWWCFHCTHWNPCMSLLAIPITCKDGHFTSVQSVLHLICFPCLWSRKWIRMRGW